MKHSYTVETLYHFNCGVCQNWWSYAVTPTIIREADLQIPTNIEYYCPHCGADETAIVKEGFLPIE